MKIRGGTGKICRAFVSPLGFLLLFPVLIFGQGQYRYNAVNGISPNVATVDGRTYAITLHAKDRGGRFDGDELGVWDITDSNPFGCRNRLEVGTQTCNLDGVPVTVRFKGGKKNEVEVKIGQREKFTAELADFYVWRARSTMEKTACGTSYRIGLQGGPKSSWLFFDPSVLQHANSSDSAVSPLSPKYVVVVGDSRGWIGNQVPIADTGCWLFLRGGKWYPGKSAADLNVQD